MAGKNNIRRPLRRLFFIIAVPLWGLALVFLLADRLVPLPAPVSADDYARVIVAEDQTPLRSFADDRGVWRYPISLAEVSPLYLQALLGYEDRWFYRHPGINPLALWRAWQQNSRAGRIVSGGSTLTMQVARLLTSLQAQRQGKKQRPRSYLAKAEQLFRALQLELHYSKEEILTLYLNHAPFGGVIEGVAAASYAYLGKPPQELSHAEAALLAVLPQAPSRLRPDRYPQRATAARDKVLERLASFAIWSPDTVAEAKVEAVEASYERPGQLAPLLSRRLKPQARPDQALHTTLRPELQAALAAHVKEALVTLPPASSVALLVVENSNLAVRAYVGSADFLDNQRFGHVDMVQAKRSPGSALKPFLYGLALDQGLIHSASLLCDTPRAYSDYRPENFTMSFSGPVTASQALQRSLNVPAIQLMEQLGPPFFTARLRDAGLHLVLPPGARANLAIILGGVAISLEELVQGYSALARQGRVGRLRYLAAELDQPQQERQLLSAGAAWVIREILAHNPRPDLYRTSAISRQPLAWKTGTSFGFRDAWAVGVTPRYTVGVWVGRPDGTAQPGQSGSLTAAPLLFETVAFLGQQQGYFSAAPASVSRQQICWPLGTLEAELSDPSLCHERHLAWLVDGNVPPTFVSPDRRDWQLNPITVELAMDSGLLVPAGCEVPATRTKKLALWPKELAPWLASHLSLAGQLPPPHPACQPLPFPAGQLRIVGINQGDTLRFAERGQRQLQVDAIGGLGQRYWFVNGQFVSLAASLHYTFEQAGSYHLALIDEHGNSDGVRVHVK